MSGFLQRLVARSRSSSTQSADHEHSVRPQLGSRFEPAFGVHAQALSLDMPLYNEEAVSTESSPVESTVPDVRLPREQPARTITPPAATSHTELPSLTTTESVQPAQEAGERDPATDEVPAAPEIVRPRPQSTRPDATSDEGEVSRTERRHRPIRDAQPATPVQPRAPVAPLAGDETVGRSISADEAIIRTIRVVREPPISVRTVDASDESPPVQPAPDERQQPVSQPITPEPQALQPVDSPQEPARVRAERTADPIRPKVSAAPVPIGAEQQPPRIRRLAADPPTIRVTIGRIEVRAEQPRQPTPTQTRRQPVRRTPALSLDDYLAKRNEGGR